MPNPLVPELSGTRLSVEAVMARPTIFRDRIAVLADKEILLPKVFRPYGARVEGGGMLYSVVKASDFFTADDVERRAPGSEYAVLRSTDPESKLAVVDDFGGVVHVLDEDVLRNDINRIDSATVQLKNRIVRSLDVRTIAAIEKAVTDGDIDTVAVSTPWDEVLTRGPLDQLSPPTALPTGAFAQAQELADLDELGVQLDHLLVHPSQARALKTMYCEDLDAVLKSAGLTMFSSARITEGTAYVVQAAASGTVGFEVPLTVEVVREPLKRRRSVMAYCVPAIAVTNPGAIKKLVALS